MNHGSSFRRRFDGWHLGRHVVLATISISCLFPLYFMLSTALKTQLDYAENRLGLPTDIVFDNFEKVFGYPTFTKWIFNSAFLSISSVLIGLLISMLLAFTITQHRWRGRRVLFRVLGGLIAVPMIVMISPLYRLWITLGLVNTLQGAIIVYAGSMIPYVSFFLIGFLSRMPRDVIEAGRIDGCSDLGLIRWIVVPLMKPVLITMGVVNALFVWNELLVALVLLNRDELRTLMVGLTVFRSRYAIDVPATAAGLVVAAAPIVIIYLLGQRYFTTGLTMGSVKGED